ncbi:hypothetical protein [Angelakisella massiliensis]|uniref:hypothetical protein n=1 Tax=Angelakisella massiliensis TaxID=1871018 RepID=UPI0024B15F97|nr:hypothetical protein [Angelakisella massiliensis]
MGNEDNGTGGVFFAGLSPAVLIPAGALCLSGTSAESFPSILSGSSRSLPERGRWNHSPPVEKSSGFLSKNFFMHQAAFQPALKFPSYKEERVP